MKKYFPILLFAVTSAVVGLTLRPAKKSGEFDVADFGRLPVLANGRIKPFDTVARSSLLQLQGRQRVVRPDGKSITPAEWLLDVCFQGDLANAYQTFEIVHPEVLALFDLKTEDGAGGKRFSFNQLQPKLSELERQAKLAEPVEAAVRTPFQRGVLQLFTNLIHYQQLSYALVMPHRDDFLGDLLRLQESSRPASRPCTTSRRASRTTKPP
jgi:hypothetical protein